ncbi:AraC family transcriptional regulator [Rufibacter sp. DG15C]|uniref:GyrI-like domain-containing protein n=1 Tax=Rufibacter sp. DG15C TaxID=1379909 RepID=UPI00078B5165|nr:GyrI-like domain-containing protein [Rufibacter sp. DG15C]AMM51142.1 AraC family transcriptional regulator [Rufibacter sp. DG15C]
MEDPKIVDLAEKRLAGLRITTSLVENNAPALWQQFMPRHREIAHRVGQELYSVQEYPVNFFSQVVDPNTKFEKWAAVEVSTVEHLPEGLELLVVPAGKYAVFLHKGISSEFHVTAGHIFGTWLPTSGYTLDHRPHFEVMGEKYLGHTNPASEEQVWIPIK